MTNTEKPTTKAEQKKQGVVGTGTNKKQKQPEIKTKQVKKEETKKTPEPKQEANKKQAPKVKKTEATAKGVGLPISTKYAIAICRHIKKKRIPDAIKELENAKKKIRAIPTKGEIPHQKGKGMMSGIYPVKASEHFIKLLKSLLSNAEANDIENPVIVEAVANIGQRPYGRFGRVKRKRTHVKLVAKNIKLKNKKQKKK